MKVLNPTLISGSVLNSTSVAEADYPAWLTTTTYAKGARTIVVTDPVTHRIYESTIDGNIGNDPRAAGTTKWIDIGPTNRWAMFDQVVGTQTVDTGSITVSLAPGNISALAIIDTDAILIRVVVSVSGTTLYDVTKSTNAGGDAIADWYAYFYAEVGTLNTITFLDLPSYADCLVTVTITGAGPSTPVGVGTLLVGTIVTLGTTEAGVNVGITDFSKKTTDDFGATKVVERAWSKKMTARSLVPTSSVDNIQRRLASIRAKPALYMGEEGFDSLAVYGFFKDFSIDLQMADGNSYVSLTVEGLI